MKLAHLWYRRFHWLNLPGAVLLALLQRTPVLRLAVNADEMIASSPTAAVVRALGATVASLGAVHALAGATQFTITRNPISGTVGTAISPVAFTVTGAQTPAGSYKIVNGSLPPGISIPGMNTTTLILNGVSGQITGTPTASGTYTIGLRAWEFANAQGDSFPNAAFVVTFNITGGTATGPTFTTQPAAQAVNAGATVTFTAAATGTSALKYQWQKDNANLSDTGSVSGSGTATLTVMNVQGADAGSYRLVVTDATGSATSAAATLAVSPVALDATARLTNLSVRTVMTAGQTLIVGMTTGGGAHPVLLRAAGPALATLGVPNAMADPRIENSTAVLNDNWDAPMAPVFTRVGAFAFSDGSKDAALVQTLNGGASFLVRGTDGGVVLVESYDLGTATQRLTNLSARNFAGTGDNILIAGFNVSGDGSGAKQLLIRAIGPKLAGFGVSGFLADPKLEVYNNAGVKVTENDNWSPALSPVFASVGAFALDDGSKDAAVLIALAPGAYTAQVKGANGGTGEALIEVYEVP